ncbi:MAG: hypothetical protein DHS20C19_22090 [Acidimicrobiales bacterium]|nr:MAG: hypothetical protein DHS20C19_22090 [Acidimicrobiales bacterium]
MSTRPHHLETVVIGDAPSAWAMAGFVIDDDRTTIAGTTIILAGAGGDRGIRAVDAGIDGPIDGMAFGRVPTTPAARQEEHPNRVVDFDHLVAMSPHMDRTTAALTDAGLEHRRTRTFEAGGATRRQAFFWLGDVILELVGDDTAHGDGPATLWGLALSCDDLDAAADALGDALGRVKPAVQPGRRIATMRTRELDISIPIALMSPHPAPDA